MQMVDMSLPALLLASALLPSEGVVSGWLPEAAAGRFWVMGDRFRAEASERGLEVRRGSKLTMVQFPGARLRWQTEGAESTIVSRAGSASWVSRTDLRAVHAYPGIDVVLRSGRGSVKAEFEAAPNADLRHIRYCFSGVRPRAGPTAKTLIIDDDWREEGLRAWQTAADGERRPVEARYVVRGECVSIRLDSIDPALPTTVDPDYVFSTYLGGGLFDSVTGATTDASGNIYLAGWTESTDFPVLSGYQSAAGGRIDGFIVKLSPTGQLLNATFLGGSGEDRIQAIALDSAGNIVVTGFTASTNFPLQLPVMGALSGGRDAFITKLNAAGTQLVFSSYFGGTSHDMAWALAVDVNGFVVFGGETSSTSLPLSAPLSGCLGGGDAFLVRLSPSGALQNSTCLGGTGADRVRGLAFGPDSVLHVTGSTASADFPVVAPTWASRNGAMDCFYMRIANSMTSILFSTYLGGSGGSLLAEESGFGVGVDPQNRAWIAGVTPSSNFPNTAIGYQPNYGGGQSDGFVSVFNGNTNLWSTYLGGSGIDGLTAVTAAANLVAVAGYSTSQDVPVRAPVQSTRSGEYDAVWAVFPPGNSTPLHVSYLGGSASDSALAVASGGSAIVAAGSTLSANLPNVSSVQAANAGAFGGFATRIRLGPVPVSVTPQTGSGATPSFALVYSDTDGATDIQTAQFLIATSPQATNACAISYSRPSNQISLYIDSTSSWASAAVGAAVTLQNTNCSLNAATVSAALVGHQLSLNLSLSFASAFGGAKKLYGSVADATLSSGWLELGGWHTANPAPPTVTGITPSAGAGQSQTFTVTFADANGATDIATAQVLFSTSTATSNACHISYSRSANTVSLWNDASGAWLVLTPGATASVDNGRCTLNGAGLSAISTGNNLVLTLPLGFSAGFTGAKTIYGQGTDTSNLTTGWVASGVWTVAGNSAPAMQSVTPSSGNSSAQTFTVVASDADGAADIQTIFFLINSASTAANGCYISVSPAQSVVRLFRDSDQSWLALSPGAAQTVENTNCSLSGTGLSITSAGTTVTVTLPLTFKAPFQGQKQLYSSVADTVNQSSGWISSGSWNLSTPIPYGIVGSPSPNTTLTSASVLFSWSAGSSAIDYWLDVGTSPGQGTVFGGVVSGTSKQVTNIPCNGQSVFVRLWTRTSAGYLSPLDYIYTAAASCQNGPRGVVTTPQPGSTLTSAAPTFFWDAGTGALDYWLDVGTAVGQGNIFGGVVTSTSRQVTGVPCNGQTIHVRLWTRNSTGYLSPNDYTYTAASSCAADPRAAIASPTPSTSLGNNVITFVWTAGTGAVDYWLDVGTALGQGNISGGVVSGTSKQVSGLPCNGQPVHVRLWTRTSAGYLTPIDYSYTAATSCTADPRATLSTPSPGTTLAGKTVTFTWSAGTGALDYWLDVGSAVGQGNISAGTVATTSRHVTNLPCNSAPVFARLWTRTSAGYLTPIDYSFTAAAPGCP